MNVAYHILRTSGFSCQNRDETGAPKSGTFGGTERTRKSSQSMKRAIRDWLSRDERTAGLLKDIRTKEVEEQVLAELLDRGVKQGDAEKWVTEMNVALRGKKKGGKDGEVKDRAVVHYSPLERKAIVDAMVEKKSGSIDIKKLLGGRVPVDGLGIRLCGRMMASCPSCNVEAALSVSHAISTHESTPDWDYFSASGEREDSNNKGAVHLGEVGFVAPCMYECVVVDLDKLFGEAPYSELSAEVKQGILAGFSEAVMLAVPGGRRTTYFSNTEPAYVLAVVSKGQPLHLVNAFETPVHANGEGVMGASIKALRAQFDKVQKSFGQRLGIEESVEFVLGETNIDEFVGKVVKYVP